MSDATIQISKPRLRFALKPALAMSLLLLLGCGNKLVKFAHLVAEPQGIGFDCVLIGCDTKRTVRLVNDGELVIQVNSITLDENTNRDYSISEETQLPFLVGPGRSREFSVSYRPSDADLDKGTVIVHYAAIGGMTQELRIHIEARHFGEPKIAAEPPYMNFGFTPLGDSTVKELAVKNVGSGTAILALVGMAFRGGVDSPFTIAPMPDETTPVFYLNPGQSKIFNMTFTPQMEGSAQDTLVVGWNDLAMPPEPLEVSLWGTTKSTPVIDVLPLGSLGFGSTVVGNSMQKRLIILSIGGAPLILSRFDFEQRTPEAYSVTPSTPDEIPVLQVGDRTEVIIDFTPIEPGEYNGNFLIYSDDPDHNPLRIPLKGSAIKPELEVTPANLDFGNVVSGWTTEPEVVTLKNIGVGRLDITEIKLGPGTGPEFILTPPSLPATLADNGQLTFEVKFHPPAFASYDGKVVIKSSDPDNPAKEVILSGKGVSCADGCQVPHASSTCTTGECKILQCDSGWYDTDTVVSNGCECKIDDPEPGAFCSGGKFLGTFVDADSDQKTIYATLHHSGDVDWYSFFADDEGGINELFSDSFDVRIQLSGISSYNIKMCVYYEKRDSHENVCTESHRSCTTNYRKDGSWGSSDAADFYIKIYTDDTINTCESYKLYIKNG